MKKFEKTQKPEVEINQKNEKSFIFDKLKLLKFLPQILEIMPKLNLNSLFFNQPCLQKTQKQQMSENQKHALKKMHEHTNLVSKLNKKSPN